VTTIKFHPWRFRTEHEPNIFGSFPSLVSRTAAWFRLCTQHTPRVTRMRTAITVMTSLWRHGCCRPLSMSTDIIWAAEYYYPAQHGSVTDGSGGGRLWDHYILYVSQLESVFLSLSLSLSLSLYLCVYLSLKDGFESNFEWIWMSIESVYDIRFIHKKPRYQKLHGAMGGSRPLRLPLYPPLLPGCRYRLHTYTSAC